MPAVGATLKGRLDTYVLGERLVTGRFGDTFSATRERDEARVIIKTLELGAPATFAQRETFERVVERLRRVEHPGIAAYLDGIAADGEDFVATVQHPAPGRALSELLEGRSPMTHDEALEWFVPVLDALDAMHAHRPPMIHGDLDTRNIFVDEEGQVTLVDFATVRQALLDAPTLAGGMATGSLDFAPLEQLLGRVFPSSDLYALAMTYLSATTGKSPREFPIDVMRPDVAQLVHHDTPVAMVQLLTAMTEPDPRHRTPSAKLAIERTRRRHVDLNRAAREAAALGASGSRDARDRALLAATERAHEWLEDLERDVTLSLPEYGDVDRLYAAHVTLDGTVLALAHAHDVVVVRADTFKVRGRARTEEPIRRVALSRDGSRLAVLTGFEELVFFDVQVSMWERARVMVDGMWPGNAQMEMSPDGDLVAISDDDQVNLYDWEDGNLLGRFDLDGRHGLCFAPDGRTLFVTGAEHTVAFDLEQLQAGETHPFTAVSVGPDGATLATVTGRSVRVGPWSDGSPSVDWDHDEVRLDVPEGTALTMLRFSPDQRTLAVASSEGVVRLVDLEAKQGRRPEGFWTEGMPGAKIFALGFGADSEEVLAHAKHSLSSEEARAHLPLPGVQDWLASGVLWSHDVGSGRFLGALAWHNERLMLASADGFYGDLDGLEAGFMQSGWERASLARAAFCGDDIEGLLTSAERAAMAEFEARLTSLRAAQAHHAEPYDLAAVVGATAGVGHVLAEVFAQADEQRGRVAGALVASTSMTDVLLDAAAVIRGQDEPMRDEVYQRLLAQAAGMPDEDLDDEARAIESPSSEDDDPGEEGSRAEQDVSQGMTPAVTRSSKGGALANTESGASSVPESQDIVATGFSIPRFTVALLVGFGVVYTIFFAVGVQDMSRAMFWSLLLVVAPLLTASTYVAGAPQEA